MAIIAILTNSSNPQVYWRVLKKRLKDEGNETVTNCNGLKMEAPDGITEVALVNKRKKNLEQVDILKTKINKQGFGGG